MNKIIRKCRLMEKYTYRHMAIFIYYNIYYKLKLN